MSCDKNKFPLPVKIPGHKNPETINSLSDEFFSHHDFIKQFNGLKNIVDTRRVQNGYFLYPIVDVYLANDVAETFEVTFDRVTFISPQHPKLKALRENFLQKEVVNGFDYYNLFFGENQLLGYVALHYDKSDATSQQGRKIVAAELEQFNAYLNVGEATLLAGHHFLLTNDFTESSFLIATQFPQRRSARLNKESMMVLGSNPFQRLLKSCSKAAKSISRVEQTFMRAYQQEDVASYWLYFENLFWLPNQEHKQVKSRFTKLAMHQRGLLINWFEFNLGHLLNPNDRGQQESLTGLTQSEASAIYTAVVQNRINHFNWHHYRNKIVNTFLETSIEMLDDLRDATNSEKWSDYFDDIIQELFDYRNAELHSGIVNEYSKIKLTAIAPGIVSRIRNLLVNTAEQHPELDLEQVLAAIVEGKQNFEE